MATASALESNSKNHIRSISLPSRSNPNIVGIEEQLDCKLKTQEPSATTPTAATICSGLSGLQGLYKRVDDLLNLPLTQQALFRHQQERCVDELLEGSVKLLDICSTIRDFLSEIKEHVVDLQSAIRRRKGDLSIGSGIAKFTSLRKNMRKEARRLIADLKQVGNHLLCSSVLDLNHHLSAVIRVVREASAMSISVFQSLLLFLSSPVSKLSRPSKWSLVSKLTHKGGALTCEEQLENKNELENVGSALCTLCICNSCESAAKMEIAQKKLEALHAGIEFMGTGMECMFRRLIRTRASLLNIISHL